MRDKSVGDQISFLQRTMIIGDWISQLRSCSADTSSEIMFDLGIGP